MKTPLITTLFALCCATASANSAALTSGIDTSGFEPSVRAQDDLFHATNGKWIERTPIPADKSTYGSFIQLRDKSDAQVRAIVTTLTQQAQTPGSNAQKIADTYSAFLDTRAIDSAGLKPLQAMFARIDAIASPQALAAWLGSAQHGANLPIKLLIGADFKHPERNSAKTWQGGLGLPDRDYYLKDDKRLRQARAAYQRYLATLAKLAGLAAPGRLAAQTLAFETRLAQQHWDQVAKRDPGKSYNPMSPAELAQIAPGFAWSEFLAAAGVAEIDSLSVSQPSAMSGTARLVHETPLPQVKTYLKLRLLDHYAQLLPAPYRAAHFAFHGRALGGTQRAKPRWQEGIAELDRTLGEAVGQIYVAQHFPPANKARMQDMVDTLRKAYASSINELSWMSAPTKAEAQNKLAKFAVKIGYPERWRDYSTLQARRDEALGNRVRAEAFEWARKLAKLGKPVDRSEWWLSPQTVNAYYNAPYNEIVFPAAILQPPFFDMQADDAANYGAIGAVIGHEISHGFDDAGSQFDGDGKLRNWWQEADRQAFAALGQQLVAQYSAYEALPGLYINGKLTLGENIADLSGLQIAYKAYQLTLGGKPAPVIDGMSGEQRFFYAWAQAWRSKVRNEALLQRLTSDPHSPAQYRANGAVLNHDGFHEAFDTQVGDRLYKPAAERIRIW